MKMASPLKYTDVTEKQYEQFRLIAKGHGLNITGNKDTATYDSVGIQVLYDKDKQTLEFNAHEPFWMAPGTIAGHLHTLVAEAMADRSDQQPQPESIRRAQDPGQISDSATEHNKANGHNVKETSHHTTEHAHPAQHAAVRR